VGWISRLGGLSDGDWRGADHVAQRHVPSRMEGLSELEGRAPSKPRVGPIAIVIRAPAGEGDASLSEGCEQGLVQHFVPQATVETLDEAVFGRLARRDVM